MRLLPSVIGGLGGFPIVGDNSFPVGQYERLSGEIDLELPVDAGAGSAFPFWELAQVLPIGLSRWGQAQAGRDRNFGPDVAAIVGGVMTALTAACMLASTVPAAAQAQVAVVEGVNSKTAGVEFMDYIPVGKVIRLGPQDTIVLGYMKSCWREEITGGTVTVGK